jgi:ribosomal protein S18 acetylase RimI-like enzyme
LKDNDNCFHFQALLEEFNLPEQGSVLKGLEISRLPSRSEYNLLQNLFLEIFPDEFNFEKAKILQDLQVWQLVTIFIVRIKNQIIGFLITKIIEGIGYIFYLGILDEYRSQGVATALLNEFKVYLKEKQISKVQCKIRKDNEKVLHYIETLGFHLIS